MEEQNPQIPIVNPTLPEESKLLWFRRRRYWFYIPLIAIFAIAASLSYLYAASKTPTDLPIVIHHRAVKGESVSDPATLPPAPAKPVPQPIKAQPVQSIAAPSIEVFAKCLKDQQAKMYGASWCPHCQNEKKSFGTAWQYVPYVECTENPDACSAAGVSGFPTWILKNGQK
ncbi:MAG: thioredoxin domain-containing protein, partial [Candidatus Saccharibacteria bacterium]